MSDTQTTSDYLSARLRALADTYVSRLSIRGDQGKGLCCFHAEKTPSLFFDFNKAVFYCFGCGTGGGVKDFALAVGESWGTIHHSRRERARAAVHARRLHAEETARTILIRRKDEREFALWDAYFQVHDAANDASELLALFHRRPDLVGEFSLLVIHTEREYSEAVNKRALIEAQIAEDIEVVA